MMMRKDTAFSVGTFPWDFPVGTFPRGLSREDFPVGTFSEGTFRGRLELEVVLGVVVRDVFHHLAETVPLFVRDFAVLHIGCDEVTHDAAEILVARIREERAGVGKHTYETAEESEEGEAVHLLLHTVLLIEEPPT
jgi:hypothetical protein